MCGMCAFSYRNPSSSHDPSITSQSRRLHLLIEKIVLVMESRLRTNFGLHVRTTYHVVPLEVKSGDHPLYCRCPICHDDETANAWRKPWTHERTSRLERFQAWTGPGFPENTETTSGPVESPSMARSLSYRHLN